jgi:hypothetical protein
MAGDGQWKYTHAGMPPRGPSRLECITLRKELLENSSTRLFI